MSIDLSSERAKKVKELCYLYNNLPPSKEKEKRKILKKLFGYKTNVNIDAPFYCDFGVNISFGKGVYLNHNCIILDGAPVFIGDNVLIGPNTIITPTEHPIHSKDRDKGLCIGKIINIDKSVWIGANVTILGGVSIGKGSVIGAGSVVTKDIPPDVIAFGNPCRVHRKITSKDRLFENPDILLKNFYYS